MFLKSISLKNFRCFSDHELSFINDDVTEGKGNIRKTTILLGPNGTGKSNLLKAIALVTAGRDALAELLGEPSSWIQVGKEFCQIDAVLQTALGEERQVFLRIQEKDSVSKVLDRAKKSLRELNEALEFTNRNYFVLAYGASRRLNVRRGRRDKGSGYRHPRALDVSTLFNPDETLIPIESWAMDMDYKGNQDAMYAIKKVTSEFLRGVTFSRIDKERGNLIFRTPHGDVPMSQLSDGYQSVASWVGDLIYRITEAFGNYRSPLRARGLLLIDEVDLHLHPSWQRELLDFLSGRLPNFQVVATTHSPFTAQQANKNELHYIEKRGKSLKLHQFTGNPEELLLHQLVMSDVFGLKSDESLVQEKRKARYEKLRDTKNPTEQQKKELEDLVETLSTSPRILRSNMLMSQEHLDLLSSIKEELTETYKG